MENGPRSPSFPQSQKLFLWLLTPPMGLPMLGMNFGLGSFFDPTGPKKVIFRDLLWEIIENVAQIAIWLISLLRQVYDLDFGVSNERTRTITTNFEKWAYIFGANQVIKVEG